jgi:hypothetical protein
MVYFDLVIAGSNAINHGNYQPRMAIMRCILFLFCLVPSLVFAWGRDGHETIGYIAAAQIKGTNAESHVAALLKPGETLATAAEWPDCAKGYTYCQAALTDEMKEYGANNPKHHNYHYTDVPFQLSSYEWNDIGANPDDVVHVLQDAILTLQNQPLIDPSHKFTQREALFVVAHMVGDIHQPLHVGAAYVSNLKYITPKTEAKAKQTFSEGGNWLCVGSTGLHSLWDTHYVQQAMKHVGVTDDEAFAKNLSASGSVNGNSGNPITWPKLWATESLLLANDELSDVRVTNKRHQGPKGSCSPPNTVAQSAGNMWTVVLPPGYADHASQTVVPEQLHKAGVRLANVLKAIWP